MQFSRLKRFAFIIGWTFILFILSSYIGAVFYIVIIFMIPVISLFFGIIMATSSLDANTQQGKLLYDFLTLVMPSVIAAIILVFGVKGRLLGTGFSQNDS